MVVVEGFLITLNHVGMRGAPVLVLAFEHCIGSDIPTRIMGIYVCLKNTRFSAQIWRCGRSSLLKSVIDEIGVLACRMEVSSVLPCRFMAGCGIPRALKGKDKGNCELVYYHCGLSCRGRNRNKQLNALTTPSHPSIINVPTYLPSKITYLTLRSSLPPTRGVSNPPAETQTPASSAPLCAI